MNAPLSPRQEAEFEQGRGSDPSASAWVTASAGSGKTKVLTDRVLRLLLAEDARPNAILCLTFTKAAAAEMSTRLARELGRWAVMPEAKLADRLSALLGRVPSRADMDCARKLFCRVLELPGGMRISTIHAFCQSLLRAFPLEAGLSPQFGVVEDSEAAALLADAREEVLAGPRTPRETLEALAGLVPPDAFAKLVAALQRDRERLGAALRGNGNSVEMLGRAIAAHLGLEAEHEAALVAEACAAVPDLVAIARLKQASKTASDQERGAKILAWLALDAAQRAARWGEWCEIFLTKEFTPRASLATKGGLKDNHDRVATAMLAEAERVATVEGSRRACRLLAATRALLGLGAPVLDGYRARKLSRGLMDYDDLILAAQAVLRDPGSAWVLYKLDGGLEHVLLDEAQDSNPAQWGIAAALTEEFFAGRGVEKDRPQPIRTIFAVGDVKQSIYGFQGADATGFGRWKHHFAERCDAISSELRDVQLKVSFRSTAPVLALVDAVFANAPARAGVVEDGATLEHRADRVGHAGSVELWPMLEAPETEPPPPWEVPDAPGRSAGADALLAEALAAQIRHWLDTKEMLESRGRAIRPGDILVLVRRRTGSFVPRLLRALKERGVPVGGADRMRLAEQIAVQDLLALCDVLLLPEDDLQLAAVLKSPLVGLDEEQLFALAHDRPGGLWARLAQHRGSDTPEGHAADMLARLMARADLVTPHSLLAEVLGEHRGREKLLTRLGPDAADALDELLNAALDHERRHPPSLQGFVQWLRRGGAEVKREQDSASDAVRVMTVHNAKGLQAPVVILPDTVGSGRDDRMVRWHMAGDTPIPLWAPRKEFHAPAYAELLEAEKRARAEEEHRLLYVALTRAEDRLLVCGWQRKRPKTRDWPEGCWYDLVAQGFDGLGAVEEDFAPQAFGAPADCAFARPAKRRFDCDQTAAPKPDDRDAPAPVAADLPEWAGRPAPAEAGVEDLAPSAIPAEDETPAAAPHGRVDPTGRRFRRGRLVHALLQHLPDRAAAEREAAARAFLARPGHGLDAREQAETLAEVIDLLAQPDLAAALGPGSLAEAPLAGRIGERVVNGQVDRLLVTPERVLVLDYKTNRPPPTRIEDVPALYLRQMAAYRAVLRMAYPGRAVECALVWTYGARFMPLPPGLLDAHAPRA
ncbi:double-strand break repair helicase AddA [Falsiroseomonas oryziterrae]|uniref:double-strand break repair helicase AddA n=1 Tax=Falsiroseomonas oryziterrae TaxID=2911368 RepID=UPI001F01E95D|nr:double-strand break repair helicase AddA [Roseomonas sp. NPKOSM-4]